MAAANWSGLLPEILQAIAENYLSSVLEDFVMFSCVCSSWHRAASAVKPALYSRHHLPWLMLTDHAEGDGDGDSNTNEGSNDHNSCFRRNLFDLSNSKTYGRTLPQAFNKACYATGTGWILTVGLDRSIHLFNPHTTAQLALPSYRTFLHQPINEDNEWFRCRFIRQTLIVRPPYNSKDQLLVVVIYGQWHYIALAKPGDSSWTEINIRERKHDDAASDKAALDDVVDAAYCASLGLVLFFHWDGQLSFCRVQPDNTLSLVGYVPNSSLFPEHCLISHGEKFYVLDSFGDVLLVRRAIHTYIVSESENILDTKSDYYTYDFDVFKLNLSDKEWKVLDDLGDLALFVGNGPAHSVVASRFNGCKSNSIYFNDDCRDLFWTLTTDGLGGRDMGVFDVRSGEIEPIYHGDDHLSSYSAPLWLLPDF